MSNANESNWYATVLKGWQVKQLGSKPTEALLHTIHCLNARPGKQALACAMALRPEGVTAGQIIMACGAPQLNKMRGFITDGLLKRDAVPPNGAGHTVYKLTLSAKGANKVKASEARIAKAAAEADAKPADKAPKAKSKGKRKAKVTVGEPAVTDQPQADTGITAPVSEPEATHTEV